MITSRLILGTANFAKPYNGTQVKDVDAILEYAQSIGISAIETATDYETHHLDYPAKIVKVQKDDYIGDDETIVCIMAHSLDACERSLSLCKNQKKPTFYGASIYDSKDVEYIKNMVFKPRIIEFPYSVFDRRADEYLIELKSNGIHTIARSVFLRGKVLEQISPYDALAFVLMNPLIDRAIIGVDSLDQLKEIVEPLIELDKMGIDDEDVIDPRRWKND